MSDVVIRAENIGKRYTLKHQASGGYYKFSDALIHAAKAPARWIKGDKSRRVVTRQEDFWALKDVSFEVKRGEVVGIIGRNGAGKSTLLKILSRITEPTSGRITLRGRIASLLEVGTGFHPELTGRENIFLNGAILGMKKNEIKAKFDEIVNFAEVEKFLDTPVKHYSSGMYVRLAFAVAAHLEPEILVVDEVLAVGDAEFQKKCLGKMQDVANGGRTVLFVSHNLTAVRQLTTRCFLLDKGLLAHEGSPEAVIDHYLESADTASIHVAGLPRVHECTGDARMVELRFMTMPAVFASGDKIEFVIVVAWKCAVSSARISLTVFTQDETPVGSGFSDTCIGATAGGQDSFLVCIPPITLAPGRYHCTVALGVSSGVNMDAVASVLHFEIFTPGTDGAPPVQWNPNWGALQLASLEVTPLQ